MVWMLSSEHMGCSLEIIVLSQVNKTGRLPGIKKRKVIIKKVFQVRLKKQVGYIATQNKKNLVNYTQ